MAEMKSIPFNSSNVRAILAGNKTQTRRVIPGDNEYCVERDQLSPTGFATNHGYPVKHRYSVGDILYVRETHYVYGKWVKDGLTNTGRQQYRFVADGERPIYYEDSLPREITICTGRDIVGYYKRPSLFMPRQYARIFVRVTGVRAERVQDISEEDAKAEGCNYGFHDDGASQYIQTHTPQEQFAAVWDNINSKRGFGWDVNPWVWVYEFAVERIVK